MDITKIKSLLNGAKQKRLSAQQGLTLFMVSIALLGLISSLRFGLASLDYYFARNAIEEVRVEGRFKSTEQYAQLAAVISDARAMHASHPLYIDMAGQIEEWAFVSGFESEVVLSAAKQSYLDATQTRPSWPVTWGALAMTKWRKQEFDDEMLNYLNKADRFGPQKPEIHLLFTKIGLALYTSNHPFYSQIREQTKARTLKALRHSEVRQQALAVIELYDALDFACAWSKEDETYVHQNVLECEQ